MEGTSFNEFFLSPKLENNELNDKVDVLSNPQFPIIIAISQNVIYSIVNYVCMSQY